MELVLVTKRKIRWTDIKEPEQAAPVSASESELHQTVPGTSSESELHQTVPGTSSESEFIPGSNQTDDGSVPPKKKRKYHRVGNGHKKRKVRNLYDSERDLMRNNLFLPHNGQITDYDCTKFKEKMASEVSVFQVTGFVSVLHTYVAEGRLHLKSLSDYEHWMRIKYSDTLWARYNNPLYVNVRKKNQELINSGQKPAYKVKEKV